MGSSRTGLVGILCAMFGIACVACAAGGPKEPNGATSSADASVDAKPQAPGEKPFAGSATEATQLIALAIDKKSEGMERCVREFRRRKHLAHQRVEVQVGIDQDGRLLGVTLPKGAKDAELSECMMQVLKDASFPRSHAGVISITKTYEEIVE